MKVFAYDIKTGKRGTEVLGEVNCCWHGSYQMALPDVVFPSKISSDENWSVAGQASDRQNRPFTAKQFGQEAICFCIGHLKCGTDEAWEWVILVTPNEVKQ